eukprot:CAMPEP_0201698330 /NCGR_PEP_ID=MMETSP0578-20130828/18492_1 /ASSEMBLY_ACC=CAM_ASM_000663 /TAXON_ID=267565 /ORGANISM="Skeletonema grethea, Strain CCMP 1804" /LENGTH=191 /DNA_ID=CAMNT_0048184827 /DNA_START=23 /DNA_END=595 /DNA_ORIENTATION=+
MKLSTKFIAALATSTFLVAVSAEDCNSITDAVDGFGAAADVLSLISEKVAPLQVFLSVAGVVANLACAVEILTAEDVKKIAGCLDRENDLERLQFGVESLADLISANKLPGPSELDNYASEAQALEADGASTGYQAALLNVDLAVIKLAMSTSKYLSLEGGDEINNAKEQAVAGIEQSLKYMKELEDDLDS